MLRISWAKKLTNDKVLDLAEERRVLIVTIRKRQLVFFGHIIRQNGLARLCLEGKIEGKKARGRQRVTYLASLSEPVRLKSYELIRCVESRQGFKSLVAKASI